MATIAGITYSSPKNINLKGQDSDRGSVLRFDKTSTANPLTNDSTAGAANIIDFNKSGAGSGSLFDVDITAAFTGKVIDISYGTGVAATGILFTSTTDARTGSDF